MKPKVSEKEKKILRRLAERGLETTPHELCVGIMELTLTRGLTDRDRIVRILGDSSKRVLFQELCKILCNDDTRGWKCVEDGVH